MADWRRIDIDAFDPESGRLTAADLMPPYDKAITMQELQPKITQLRTLASSGDVAAAIQIATSEPPYSADESTKAQYFHAVLETLAQTRQGDISNIIKQLSPKQQDVLVKYLYKGMSIPEGQKQSGVLLSWFEKLTQEAGVGPVVHYISDRRTL